MTTLASLGPRICILGPSNSGKSTLSASIARQRDIPAVHLDQLYHQPSSDWQPRPQAEFLRLHAAAIQQDRWVMEGNYSRCIAPRLERATGLIVLDASTAVSLFRYLRRTWFERDRHGALEGQRDSVKWQMIRHIVAVTPANRRKYAELLDRSPLPKIGLATTGELQRFYQCEGLRR